MKTGRVIVREGSLVQPHEKKVGDILARVTGKDVVFLAVSIEKSPDILFCGRKWEIKSPKGSKRRTLENNIRNAMKQSNNIIIDLSRIGVSEETCVRYIVNRKRKLGRKNSFIVIRKNKAVEYY